MKYVITNPVDDPNHLCVAHDNGTGKPPHALFDVLVYGADASPSRLALNELVRLANLATGSALPDPPAELADAWRRFQVGERVEPWEARKLDEWRDDCARDAGF